MKALRNIGGSFHGKLGSVHERNGNIQFFITSSSKCDRPRTRSSVTIWNLPDSLIVMLLKGVHVKDLLSFRSVHSYFCDIIDNHNILWTSCSFSDCWPQGANLRHFVKASSCGNVEATIKLAVAYLYKEGLTKEDVSQIASEAATYLSLAESLTPNTFPFFWIFIRPPWALDGSCCKVQAFKHIKDIVDKGKDRDLAFGIALTLKLQRLSVQGISKNEEQKYFELAANQQSAAATFFSLLDVMHEEIDTGKEYERVRLLRRLSSANILEAKLNLVRSYIQGYYGGVTDNMAKDYVQKFFNSSEPSGIHVTFSGGLTSDISRYILVDWLVEVVGMKDFSAHTLYLAVSLFDRFLQLRTVQRSKVQLLGVAAMVISSRFLGFDILTIREAAWLTDNSYTYHDVVRMMGELVATLKGNIRVLTIQDYVKVLLAMTAESSYVAMLVEYIAMLCLLQSEMGQYSPAEIAASCVLLSRLLLNKDDPWPDTLKDWTGFSQDYLSLCTFHIHKKCVLEGSDVDYRDTKLQAVKLRYADSNRCSVSNIEVIGHRELSRRLGVTRLVSHGKNTKAIRFRNTDELIVSPRRGKKHPEFFKSLSQSFEEDYVDRTNAATPPIKHSNVFEEGFSGYEGDLEEDSDEYLSDKSDVLYELTGDSDLDPSNVCDHLDESHDWDSEASLMEDEPSEELDTDDESSSFNTSNECDIGNNKIVCLSSMCQSGNNVNCRALRSTPSCCISNCSCQQPFTLLGLNLSRSPSEQSHQPFCAKSSISFMSPPSSSSTPKFLSIIQKSPFTFSNPVIANKSKDNLDKTDGAAREFVPCGNINKKSTRSHSSSSSSSSSTICDTQPFNICDDNGNYIQSSVLGGACCLAPTVGDIPSSNMTCPCSKSIDSMDKTKISTHPNQLYDGTLSPGAFVVRKNFPILTDCSSKSADIFQKSPSNISSFVEISCPSLQVSGDTKSFSDFDSSHAHTPVHAMSGACCSTQSQCKKTNFNDFESTSSLSLSNAIASEGSSFSGCSSSICMHEMSTSSSQDENAPKRLTRSSNLSLHPQQEVPSTILTETPTNHFMSAKRARLDQSQTPVYHRVSSRKYSNTFTNLLGESSHQCDHDTADGSNRSSLHFSLPSRLKRKKAC